MGSFARRNERARLAVDHFGPADNGNDYEPDGEAFLIVEKSRHSGRAWFTPVWSLEDATTAVDSQEYPEDWECVAVVDLDSGRRYGARVTTSWELLDGVAAIALPGELVDEPNPAGMVR